MDRFRMLFAEILLRAALIRQYSMPNDAIILLSSPAGKPFLKDREELCFNITHSGAWVACAIDDTPIGIDVEKIAPMLIDDVKDNLSLEEYDYLLSFSKEPLQLNAFYKLWTVKESYMKMRGTGLRLSPGSFSVDMWSGDQIRLYEAGQHVKTVFFSIFNLDNLHPMACCSYLHPVVASPGIIAVDEILGIIFPQAAGA